MTSRAASARRAALPLPRRQQARAGSLAVVTASNIRQLTDVSG